MLLIAAPIAVFALAPPSKTEELLQELQSKGTHATTKVAIITPLSLENYGKILEQGFKELRSRSCAVDMIMPEAGENLDAFANRIRQAGYDKLIVQLHGAHNEEPVAFCDYGNTPTILLVHRPEEVIARDAQGLYQAEGKDIKGMLRRVNEVVLLGKAHAETYQALCPKVSVVPHGFFNRDLSVVMPKDLSIAVVGSITTWSDMRWIRDILALMKSIKQVSPDSKVLGYVAGKFSSYKDPGTNQMVDELKDLRNDPRCIFLTPKDIEAAYLSKFYDLPGFKEWLYMKSENGNRVVVVEPGQFRNPDLTALQSSLIDFNAQLYREVLNGFKPKVEYSGTLHERPGSSIPVVFDSPSMSDVESEGLRMIKVGFSNDRLRFEIAAEQIVELINNPDRYNKLRQEILRAAGQMSMAHIARLYERIILGSNKPDRKKDPDALAVAASTAFDRGDMPEAIDLTLQALGIDKNHDLARRLFLRLSLTDPNAMHLRILDSRAGLLRTALEIAVMNRHVFQETAREAPFAQTDEVSAQQKQESQVLSFMQAGKYKKAYRAFLEIFKKNPPYTISIMKLLMAYYDLTNADRTYVSVMPHKKKIGEWRPKREAVAIGTFLLGKDLMDEERRDILDWNASLLNEVDGSDKGHRAREYLVARPMPIAPAEINAYCEALGIGAIHEKDVLFKLETYGLAFVSFSGEPIPVLQELADILEDIPETLGNDRYDEDIPKISPRAISSIEQSL